MQYSSARRIKSELATGLPSSLIATQPDHRYNPVGYVLSANKDAEDEKLQRRRAMIEDRARRAEREAATRIAKPRAKENVVRS